MKRMPLTLAALAVTLPFFTTSRVVLATDTTVNDDPPAPDCVPLGRYVECSGDPPTCEYGAIQWSCPKHGGDCSIAR